jgi:hypothetical protein
MLPFIFSLAKIIVFSVVSYGVARGCRSIRLPPVIGMLGTGFVLRYVHPSEALENASDPLVDMALAAMGLEIGSHLNEATLGAVAGQMIRFMMLFVLIVTTVTSMGIRVMLPEMAPFAALAASIAVERSSPECLQGITEAHARGPFSTSLMCISALQDVGALVCFVLSEIILGSTSFRSGIEHIGMMLASTALASGLGVAVGYIPMRYPSICLVTICIVLASAAEFTPSELLLSAVSCGAVLNYRKPHTTAIFISKISQYVGVILFTWMGYRMNIASFLGLDSDVSSTPTGHAPQPSPNILIIIGIFCLRLLALFLGSFAASMAVGLRQFARLRWMGLVTQLAIALSLVQRGERSFPHSAPLMRAYGGAVLLSLVTGPALLQVVLQRVGEAGQQEGKPRLERSPAEPTLASPAVAPHDSPDASAASLVDSKV